MIQSLGCFVGQKFSTDQPEFEPSSLCEGTLARARPLWLSFYEFYLVGHSCPFFCFILWGGDEGLHTEFCLGRLKERDNLEGLDVDGTSAVNEIINMMG
jgi:hypothetical protein